MFPIKQSEEESLNKAVGRILIALLDLKSESESLFSGRTMMNFTFSSMSLLKELNGVLAYWLTEEHTMEKHVRVTNSLLDHRKFAIKVDGKSIRQLD